MASEREVTAPLDVAALRVGWAAKGEERPRLHVRLSVGALTGAVVREDELFITKVGDSRCYLLRDDRLEQVTEDHSWVQEQVSRGAMTLEEAEMSPFRNVITRSLGAAPEVETDLFAVKLEP